MKNQIIRYIITIYLLKNKQISEYFWSVTCSDCSDTMKVRYSPGCWYFPFNGRLCNVEHSFEITAGSCFGEIAILAGGNDRDKATITDNFRETSYATEKPLAINENDNPPFYLSSRDADFPRFHPTWIERMDLRNKQTDANNKYFTLHSYWLNIGIL